MTRINTASDMKRILEEIQKNSGIADISSLRRELLKLIPRPGAWQKNQRMERLRPFADFFINEFLNPESPDPRIRAFVRDLAIESLSEQYGWKTPERRQKAAKGVRSFIDLEDKLGEIGEILFQNEPLLRLFMKSLDAHCISSTLTILKEIDEALTQDSPLHRDVVLIGGGPVTAILASNLAPFFRVTVITRQRRLGMPWRYRQIYMNNTAEALDPNGRGLPLLQGSTMKIVGSLFPNNLPPSLVLLRDTKDVLCESGRIAKYAAGPRVGKHVAMTIALNSDEVMVNQEVVVSDPLPDGGVQVVLFDRETGIRRVIHANAVFMASGPNEEQSKVPNPTAQNLYQESALELDASLRFTRRVLVALRAELTRVEALPDSLRVRVQRQRVQDQIAQLIQIVKVPRIVTLTSLEKIYEFWEEDLDGDPDLFPLTELIATAKKIAIIGDGDTGRTEAELVGGNGPESAYPSEVKRVNRRRVTLYNVTAASRQEYVGANRKRYEDVFTDETVAIPFKVDSYCLVRNKRGEEGVEVTYRDAEGRRRRNTYPYVCDATGLRARSLAELLPPSFRREVIRDKEGIPIARGDRAANLFLVGAAAELKFSDLAPELQEIIRALGIPENTLALWLNGLLAERVALDYVLKHAPTKAAPTRKR